MSDSASAKELLQRWETGDQSAAEELYHRYAQRLCDLAERRINERLRRRIDADDVLQSAFGTFFRRAANGEFNIDHSGALWNLLVTITLNKVRRRTKHHQAHKRDYRNEMYLDDEKLHPAVFVHEPTLNEAAALDEEMERLLAELQEPEPTIVRLCLEGYSTSEIAARVDCSRWTVRRSLDRIGHRLRRRLAENSDD